MRILQRASDLGAADARRAVAASGAELRTARLSLGIAQRQAAARAGLSPSQYGRIERGEARHVSVDHLCRAGRAVGIVGRLNWYPAEVGAVHDSPAQTLLGRLDRLLGSPLRMRREVVLPGPGDQRAWDGSIEGGGRPARVEAEARLGDIQALARRIALKQRDDPEAAVVILVVNRTTHNRAVLLEHRQTLRAQFPLDGAAIARALRAGQVPPAGGIILL
jgi:transcriptional regulator with XRE-family HTH domain